MSRSRALTSTQVTHIRHQHVDKNVRFASLAVEYGVSYKTICAAVAGKGAYATPGVAPVSMSRGRKRGLSYEQAEGARRRYVYAKASPALLAHENGVTVSTMLAVLMCIGTYANDGHPVKERSTRYHGHQKLSDENVREIRQMRGEGVTYEALGVRFNINPGTALNAANHTKRFALVDPPAEDALLTEVPPEKNRLRLIAKVEQMMLAGRSAEQVVDFVTLCR